MSSQLDMGAIDKLDLSFGRDGFAKYSDVETLGNLIEDVYSGSQPYLTNLSFIWERNIRFFLGDQHLYFNTTHRRFEPIPVTPYNQWLPRPITNYILPIVQTLVSIYTRRKPTVKVRPNSTDLMDRTAAMISDRVVDAKWEDDDENDNAVKSALILVLCGTVIRKDYWDASKGAKINDKIESDDGEEEISFALGDNAVEIIDPFRFIPDIHAGNYYIEANVRTLSWIRDNYGKEGNGYTGEANNVVEDRSLNQMMELHNRLKTTTGVGMGVASDASSRLDDSSVVLECYIKPTKNHPGGLHAVSAGGRTLYINKSPYWMPDIPDSWHPYTMCKYQDMHFRWHGISLVENLISLQKRINSIDSLIMLNRKTMAIPQWLIPAGSNVPEGYISGAPGLQIPYNPAGSNGARPERMPGVGLPGDIYRERDQTLQSMHAVAGTNEVLSGMRPEGVNTAMATNMLLEQSYSKFNPFIMRWERYLEKAMSKKLRVISKYYEEDRKTFTDRLKEMNRDNLDVEIKSFIGTDLKDNFNVRIEAGSSLPKSEVVEQQNMKELAQFGLFGQLDPNQNPIGNQEFLNRFGVKLPHSELNADVRRAKWINKVLTAVNRNEMDISEIPPILEIDNLQIHMKILTDRIKHPDFVDEKGVFASRYQQLKGAIEQQQMQMMQQQLQQAAPQGPGMPNISQGMPQPVGPSDIFNSPEAALNT